MGQFNNAALLLFIIPDTGKLISATIFHHKANETREKIKVGTVDDGAALPS